MNGPGGQWAKGDPRPIGPVPPSCFLPPRQLKPAPYKRDTRSMVASIALAHRVYNYDDQNLCRVTVFFFTNSISSYKMFVYLLVWLWSVIAKEVSWKILTVFVVVLGIVKMLQMLHEKYLLPPGPWGYPIVGCMNFLKGRPLHLYFRDITQKYGSLVSMSIGTQLYVVISDYKMIRDTFRKEEFTSRPLTEFIKLLEGYGK